MRSNFIFKFDKIKKERTFVRMKSKRLLKTSPPSTNRASASSKKGASEALIVEGEAMPFAVEELGTLSASELKRVKILQTAMHLFAQHGFHATGMRQICEAVGMSPGALYRYFASKEEIIAGLIALDRQRTAAWFGSLPVEEGLMACLERLTELASADFERPGYMAMWTEISAEAARNPVVREPFAEHYQFMEELFSGLVDQAKKAGDIRPETRAKDVATFVISGFEGLMVRHALVPDFEFNKAADRLLAFVADAVGSRRPKRERRAKS
jgi:TetR/AcrR family transcriptional regulator, repressor for uid operon